MRDRLLRLYEAAPESGIEAGRLWYPTAESVIASMSREYAVGRPTVAALVAALSPQQRWRTNVASARAVLAGHQPKHKRYARIMKAYAAAAAIVGETPREFQSVIWQIIRPAIEHERDWRLIHATS